MFSVRIHIISSRAVKRVKTIFILTKHRLSYSIINDLWKKAFSHLFSCVLLPSVLPHAALPPIFPETELYLLPPLLCVLIFSLLPSFRPTSFSSLFFAHPFAPSWGLLWPAIYHPQTGSGSFDSIFSPRVFVTKTPENLDSAFTALLIWLSQKDFPELPNPTTQSEAEAST